MSKATRPQRSFVIASACKILARQVSASEPGGGILLKDITPHRVVIFVEQGLTGSLNGEAKQSDAGRLLL